MDSFGNVIPARVDPVIQAENDELVRAAQRRDKFYGKLTKQMPVLSETEKAYWQKVNAAQPVNTSIQSSIDGLRNRYASRPTFVPPIPLDEARDLLNVIMTGELAKLGRVLSTAPVDVTFIDNLLRWFWRDETGPLDLHRGLLVYGNVGPGKTFAFDCIKILADAVHLPGRFTVKSTEAILNEVRAKKSFDVLTPYKSGSWVLDDIGVEGKSVKVWGETQDAFAALLAERHRLFTQQQIFTHFTSNLPPEELITRYGPRLEDRFYEWTQTVHYDAPSKRQLKKANPGEK